MIAFVLPAHNEEDLLAASVEALHAWASRRLGRDFVIVISENGSSDRTAEAACVLESEYAEVRAVSDTAPGKGAALKRGMAAAEADRYVLMDADLSVGLDSVGELLEASGHDLVIASRRMPGARVRRPAGRRMITAAYGRLASALLGFDIKDPQCGCKVLSRRLRDAVVPRVADDGFFFDTELLARAHRGGYGILERPVAWTERDSGRGSSVRIMRTSLRFIRDLMALRSKDL